MELFELAKAELLRSNVDRRHPFRYFCLATIGQYPETRTVVNRRAGQDMTVLFFTDCRSPKVEQIKNNGRVSALFYHPKKNLQVRIKGAAEIVLRGDPDFDQFLHQVKQSGSLKDYTTSEAPGSTIKDEAEILFGPTVHFSAVKIIPHHIDVLQLDAVRHKRSAYALVNGQWQETLLTP